MKRIICIGNRHRPEDLAGPAVCDLIQRGPIPEDVEVVDGGLASLNLLRYLDGAERIVFVDQVEGFARPGQVVILDAQDAAAGAADSYDHAGGLPYLLRLLPAVREAPLPQIVIVGIERQADGKALDSAAALALELAMGDCAGGTS